jgi:hypothetical protein
MLAREFEDKFTTLVAAAMASGHNDSEYEGNIIEVLARSLGRTIAILGRGDQKGISDLLDGATNYAAEEAARFKRFGEFMAKSQK